EHTRVLVESLELPLSILLLVPSILDIVRILTTPFLRSGLSRVGFDHELILGSSAGTRDDLGSRFDSSTVLLVSQWDRRARRDRRTLCSRRTLQSEVEDGAERYDQECAEDES